MCFPWHYSIPLPSSTIYRLRSSPPPPKSKHTSPVLPPTSSGNGNPLIRGVTAGQWLQELKDCKALCDSSPNGCSMLLVDSLTGICYIYDISGGDPIAILASFAASNPWGGGPNNVTGGGQNTLCISSPKYYASETLSSAGALGLVMR